MAYNLRILKKLCKRAVPLLPALGYRCKPFPAVKGDNYHGMLIPDQRDCERWPSVHGDLIGERAAGRIEPRCRRGTGRPFVMLMRPYHPKPGTPMVGSMSGGYEPEWDESCTWLVLHEIVRWHYAEFDRNGDVTFTRQFHPARPGAIFKAAAEIAAQRAVTA